MLEKHLPQEQLTEVKRILYGPPVNTLSIPEPAAALAQAHDFEIKAFAFPSQVEQLREPRVVRVGLIQNSIVLPTNAPIKDQYEAIERKIEKMVDAAAAAGVNVLCLQEAWRTDRMRFGISTYRCSFLHVYSREVPMV